MSDARANQVVCPRCGIVKEGEGDRSRPPGGGDLIETPAGTRVLPTLGMARKAAGTAGECDCGRAPHERPGAVGADPGRAGSGSG